MRCTVGAFLYFFAGAALAHGAAHPEVRVVLDGLAPAVGGITVQVYDDELAPQAVLENRTGRALEILDDNGQVLVRIGPSGGWFDPRLDKVRLEIPEAVVHRKRPAILRRWIIPARLDGKPLAIQGHFRYEPAPVGAWQARLTSPAEQCVGNVLWRAPRKRGESEALCAEDAAQGRAAQLAPGVRVTLSPGRPPALLLENRGETPVTVLGVHDEPFVRVGRAGAEANLASPTWQDQGRYRGLDADPIAGTGKRWRRVSPAPRYTWLEPRALASGGERKIWRVPVRIGERRTDITGVTEWIKRNP